MQTTDFIDVTDKIALNPIRDIHAIRGLLIATRAIIRCREKSNKERFTLPFFVSNSDLTFAIVPARRAVNF
jgi:hypothetical protein